MFAARPPLRCVLVVTVGASLLASARPARADDPFTFTARTTSGTPETVSVSGSSLTDLADDLVSLFFNQ